MTIDPPATITLSPAISHSSTIPQIWLKHLISVTRSGIFNASIAIQGGLSAGLDLPFLCFFFVDWRRLYEVTCSPVFAVPVRSADPDAEGPPSTLLRRPAEVDTTETCGALKFPSWHHKIGPRRLSPGISNLGTH
jgi:hypothetical protein